MMSLRGKPDHVVIELEAVQAEVPPNVEGTEVDMTEAGQRRAG
jgi:hypothetical protein